MAPRLRSFATASLALALLVLPFAPVRAQDPADAPHAPPTDAPPTTTPPVESSPDAPVPTDPAAIFTAFRAERDALDPKITWSDGPGDCAMGSVATIAIPKYYSFTGKDGTERFLHATGNLSSGEELATILSDPSHGPDTSWWACFEYLDPGHVKDDEKDDLDAAKLLEVRQERNGAQNEERKKQGFEPLDIVGWSVPPHYDAQTHNLEWGLKLRSKDGESVNYEVRFLSRVGFMQTTLVCSTAAFDAALPEFRKLLERFAFVDGERYDQVKQGDPIADLTLTTLVMGGAAAAAWKFGLLKYLKGIVVAIGAVVAGIWRKITGRGKAPVAPRGRGVGPGAGSGPTA